MENISQTNMDMGSNGANDNQSTNNAMKPAEKNMVMGILAYLGPLVIVSYLTAKDDQFVKFHIKQGLVLFAIEVIVWILGMAMAMYSLYMLLNLVNIAVLILSIVGIVNVTKGLEKELPVVGAWAKHFKI